MSEARQQAYIEAPVEVVWDLLSDVDRHPEWWPRVLSVECEGLEPGCTYRQVTQTPMGKDEMKLHVDAMDDCRNLLKQSGTRSVRSGFAWCEKRWPCAVRRGSFPL